MMLSLRTMHSKVLSAQHAYYEYIRIGIPSTSKQSHHDQILQFLEHVNHLFIPGGRITMTFLSLRGMQTIIERSLETTPPS